MFRVRYTRRATNELANIWAGAAPGERSDVTRASQEIDRTLRREADVAGESRFGPYRILFVEPLGVIYRLDPDGQTVTVSRVWMIV